MTVGQLIEVLNEFEGDLPTTVSQVDLRASEDEGGNYSDIGEYIEGESTIEWFVCVG